MWARCGHDLGLKRGSDSTENASSLHFKKAGMSTWGPGGGAHREGEPVAGLLRPALLPAALRLGLPLRAAV